MLSLVCLMCYTLGVLAHALSTLPILLLDGDGFDDGDEADV